MQIGFKRSQVDYSLFTCTCGTKFIALLVYVDDVIVASNDISEISHLKDYLNGCFRIKDLGRLKYFLDTEVARHPNGLVLSQRKYSLNLLHDADVLRSKPCDFLMEQKHELSAITGYPLSNPAQYHLLVGCLLYLTITKHDICYVVQVLSQFMQDPQQPHLDATMRLVRYIKKSLRLGIFISFNCNFNLATHADSDWAAYPTTRGSTKGYVIFLGYFPISWKSMKQATVSRFSAEFKYHAMTNATSELVWLHALLLDLGVNVDQPMHLICDN